MSEARADLGVDIDRVERFARNVRDNVGQVLVGGESTTDLVIAALLARGHVLIEDVPGTGKTTLARAMAASLQCEFRRIQFTPDLVPADVLGVNIYDPRQQQFNFNPGPIFSQVLLADEINRATPRTQSALLEAMQEGQVSIDGVTARLPEPFFVIATLNPVEMEGTFPLPEAQLDRFLVRVSLGYPSPEQEERMLVRFRDRPGDFELAPVAGVEDIAQARALVERVRVESPVRAYLLAVVAESRRHPQLRLGASPRASLALQRAAQAMAALSGRDYVLPDDVKALAAPVLAHRLVADTAARLRGESTATIVAEILESVAVPMAT